MNKEYWLRKAHRYLGLFIGIQLLFWTVSGFYFSWNDIEKVRGEHLSDPPAKSLSSGNTDYYPVASVVKNLEGRNNVKPDIQGIELRFLLDRPVYEVLVTTDDGIDYLLVDAVSGERIPMIDEATAVRLAREDFAADAAVEKVELLRESTAHDEYRGRDLPIYRVTMDHPSNVNIYVSASRGLVTARRNSVWRTFDFLWMLHTMDFETRDDFNNVLIKTFSVLGLITIFSGFLLWGVTSPLFKKRDARA